MRSDNRQPRHWEPDRKLQSGRKATTKIGNSLQDHREETSLALTDLQKANDDLQVKLKEIEDKNLYLEAYSRRKNIIFNNYPAKSRGISSDT